MASGRVFLRLRDNFFALRTELVHKLFIVSGVRVGAGRIGRGLLPLE